MPSGFVSANELKLSSKQVAFHNCVPEGVVTMRVILIPVADRPECANALKTAFDLGQRLGANVCGCHIRAHSQSAVSLPASLGVAGGDQVAWESASKGKRSKKSSASAKALFASVAQTRDYSVIKKPGAKPGAVWFEKTGSPDKVLSIMGPVSDLVVVSRPSSRGGKLSRMFLRAALLNTSRPVLVLPATSRAVIGRRISIAWNQSSEAAQAVSAAMPLLQMAERVTIISRGPEGGVGPKSTQLANYLRFWGVNAKRVKAPGADDGEALIAAYNDTKSDLLVMGAYSRNRLSQLIFGSVTEYMLQKANIPVFMLHT